MRTELGKAGMQPPRFKDRVTSFEVAMPSHALFDDETVSWLNHLAPNSLKDSQRIGLALMRKGEIVDNTRYRTATGVDSRVTTMELQELAAQEIIEQIGMGRGSQYVLSAHASQQTAAYHDRLKGRSRQVIELLEKHGELSKREIAELADLNPKTVGYWLTKLRRENIIEANTGSRGDRNTRYRLRQAKRSED